MDKIENLTKVEQVLILGFFPILGATSHVHTALTAIFITLFASLAVFTLNKFVSTRYGETVHWSALFAAGLGISYILANFAAFFLPIPQKSMLFLYLTGATPLVYVSTGSLFSKKQWASMLPSFVLIMAGFSVIREILGSSSLWSIPLFPDGFIPAGILAQSSGALLLFASAAMCSQILALRKEQKQTSNRKEAQQ